MDGSVAAPELPAERFSRLGQAGVKPLEESVSLRGRIFFRQPEWYRGMHMKCRLPVSVRDRKLFILQKNREVEAVMAIQWDHFFSQRAQKMKTSEIREFFKLTERPDIISFAGGFPSGDYFPSSNILAHLQKLMEDDATPSLQYGPTEGIGQLRQYLAAKMTREGIACATEDEILITNGSQQGLDLISKILLDPGDVVIVEEPGYVGGLGAIHNYQGAFLPISLDEEGLRTDLLELQLQKLAKQGKKAKFIYLVPNFQNPTGVTMSIARREKILELAERFDFIILEDNPYGELRYGGYPLPSIKSLDGDGRVIYLGSFSKTFVPGIRLGWMVAEKALIEKMITAKQGTDLCSNTLSQRLVYSCCSSGFIDDHVQSLVEKYREKRDLMLSCMERFFPPGCVWTNPKGGFFIWLTMPDSLNAREILLKAIEKKVAFVDGAGFYVNGKGKNTARFAFSEAGPHEIRMGIERLGLILNEEMNRVGKSKATAQGARKVS
jgi:2-aminoadipate transaminase